MTQQADKAPAHVDRRMVDFVREHGPRVERWLRRFGVPEADLCDARQEVWVTAYRHLPTLGDAPMQRGFLHTVCRRTARDLHRRAHRRYERVALSDAPTTTAGAPEPSVEAWFEARAKLRAVQQLTYLELGEPQRDILLSYSLGAEGPDALAVRHACPTKTVFSRLYAAREQLRRRLGRDGWLGALLELPRGSFSPPAPTSAGLTLSCLVVLASLQLADEPLPAASLVGVEPAPSESRRVDYVSTPAAAAPDSARARLPHPAAPAAPPEPASMQFNVFEVAAPVASLALHQVELLAFEPVVLGAPGAQAPPQRVQRVTNPSQLKPRLSRRFAPRSSPSGDAWDAVAGSEQAPQAEP